MDGPKLYECLQHLFSLKYWSIREKKVSGWNGTVEILCARKLMVWAFLSQVLRDGKEASCQAAVARVVSYCEIRGIAAPTEDTGDFCRARAKLSEAALHELSCEVADELEQAAEAKWLWKGRHHALLIDGFTFTMPDLVDALEPWTSSRRWSMRTSTRDVTIPA